MSTGAVLTHGVSGFPCLGQAGDFDVQVRGEPWESIVNDPIRNYMNAQNHIGVPLSNFNEPWTGGDLRGLNFSSQPYRTPVFGESAEPLPAPVVSSVEVGKINYPSHFGIAHDQQLPNARIHRDVRVPTIDRQNLEWQLASLNGDNKVFMPQTYVDLQPNTKFFQGGTTPTGTHPQNDLAGQATTANTTRPDFRGGQAPFQKLPNGVAIGGLQPNEPTALYDLGPPPDPPVLPGTGTGMLRPTAPAWW